MRKGKDPDSYLWQMDPDPEAQKHANPADPVPDPDPNTAARKYVWTNKTNQYVRT